MISESGYPPRAQGKRLNHGNLIPKWGKTMQVEERSVDSQGRISLPADWRREHLGETEDVIILRRGEDLVIKPKRAEKISSFFDSVEVELENDLADWHAVKRELLHPGKTRE